MRGSGLLLEHSKGDNFMSIKDTALAFFDACETGKGWEVCQQYCTPDASFAAQADALAEVTQLSDYTEWMKANGGPLPDAGYEMLSFGIDEDRGSVCAAATFKATHTGEGGPVPPTGKSTSSHYCYVIEFDGGKVSAMTKIWNDAYAFRELGWG